MSACDAAVDKTVEKAPLRVVCLCAAWCRTCNAYEAVFRQVAVANSTLPFYWIDIEDRYDLIGDLDIETFPTIAIFAGKKLCYLSAMLPHAGVLQRLLVHAQKEKGLTAPKPSDLPDGTDKMVSGLQMAWSDLQTIELK